MPGQQAPALPEERGAGDTGRSGGSRLWRRMHALRHPGAAEAWTPLERAERGEEGAGDLRTPEAAPLWLSANMFLIAVMENWKTDYFTY